MCIYLPVFVYLYLSICICIFVHLYFSCVIIEVKHLSSDNGLVSIESPRALSPDGKNQIMDNTTLLTIPHCQILFTTAGNISNIKAGFASHLLTRKSLQWTCSKEFYLSGTLGPNGVLQGAQKDEAEQGWLLRSSIRMAPTSKIFVLRIQVTQNCTVYAVKDGTRFLNSFSVFGRTLISLSKSTNFPRRASAIFLT